MRMVRFLVPVLLLSATLAGCGSAEDETDSSGEGGNPEPTPNTYQVPDSACPVGWTGLEVTTDTEAELEYLDDMPACTNAEADITHNAAPNSTYLENKSDAVWLLRSTSNPGMTTSIEATLGENSFVAAVSDAYSGQAIFVPGAKLIVNLAPEEVEWTVDLPLSFGWQAHDIVVSKIEAAGEAAAIAALKRQSRAGAALAVCALAVTDFAEGVADLENADPSNVLVNGLGVGASASGCRSESAAVATVDDAGRPITLADDLERLSTQTKVLEKAHAKMGWVQRAAKALGLGLKFLPR